MPQSDRKECGVVVLLVLGVILWRGQQLDQPILENYVGRQIPTAMVAKNLVRGSGFRSPQLDTGPFPNLFLVEPPIDAQFVAWITRANASLFPLDQVGRAVSAVMTGLATLGLYLLVRRRSGPLPATFAAFAFAAFPVTIRYGRAFQPDAFTLGLTVLGLALWDQQNRRLRAIGWLLIAIGLAQKVNWSLIVIPLMLVMPAAKSTRAKIAVFLTVLPALLWYGHAAIASPGGGSAASTDNAARWASILSFKPWLEPARYVNVLKDLGYRAFTPIGGLFVLFGLMRWKQTDIIWKIWLLSALGTLAILFGKLHHDYYWLMLAPAAAAWVGLALGQLCERSKRLTALALIALFCLGIWQTRETWQTPKEWENAVILGDAIEQTTPANYLVIGPEAIIYLGDRRGCRLEYDPGAVVRAANEWRPTPAFVSTDPFELVQFYRKMNRNILFADVLPQPGDLARQRLHDQIRAIPGVWLYDDQGGRFLLVGLPDLKP